MSESKSSPANEVTSNGNSLGASIALFVVIFGAFLAGLYLIGLFPNPVLFTVGMALCIVSLFAAFALVPRFLTK